MIALWVAILIVGSAYQMSLFVVTMQVWDALARRHPEVSRSIWIGNLSFGLGVFWFVFVKGGSLEGDRALAVSVHRYRLLVLGGVIALAALLVFFIGSDIAADLLSHVRK